VTKDVLRHARFDRGRIFLRGSGGVFETGARDGFYLPVREVDLLPRSWHRMVTEGPHAAYRFVEWPEPIRANGNREGRLVHFQREVFVPRRISPLEADIDPVRRFVIERPSIQIAQDWRLFYYDLETERIRSWDDPGGQERILSFSWRSSEGKRGHARLAAKTDAAERVLLETLVRLLARHDIAIAWNGARFDEQVIRRRCEILGVSFDAEETFWLDHLRCFKKYFLRGKDGGTTSSFALEAIGEALLGERKVPIEARARALGAQVEGAAAAIEWAWEHAPELSREYNDQDVDLMVGIEAKTGFVRLHLAVCAICRIFPGRDSLYPSTLIDGKMLQRGFEVGFHFPTRYRDVERDGAKARGAFVPEAVVGLHRSVAVLDYSRMYPSIIRAFNLSPETPDPSGDIAVPLTDERGKPTGKILARFRSNPEGHIPAALLDLIRLRKRYSDAQAKEEVGSAKHAELGQLSDGCKAVINAFYGIVLSQGSRFYHSAIGESVTSVGRMLLANTIGIVSRRGHRLIFGDTDSVAFTGTDEDAKAVQDEVNQKMVPELVATHGAKPGEISIGYEKRFGVVLVTASKKYAGKFAVYKGKVAGENIPADVRGLEIVRSDVCRAARSLQREVVDLVLGGATSEEIRSVVEDRRQALLAGGVPNEDLTLSKTITKALGDYANKPHHVEVAARMVERGVEVDEGQKIPFLMTDKGALHPTELGPLAGQVSFPLYWNDHVYPPTQRVLEAAFPGAGWPELECVLPRQQDPRQGDLFGGEPRRVVRQPANRLVLRVEDSWSEAAALRELLGAFPGSHHLRVDVRASEERRVYELVVPGLKVRHPREDVRFATALRSLGVSWDA